MTISETTKSKNNTHHRYKTVGEVTILVKKKKSSGELALKYVNAWRSTQTNYTYTIMPLCKKLVTDVFQQRIDEICQHLGFSTVEIRKYEL